MDHSTFEAADLIVDEIADKIDELLDSDDFAAAKGHPDKNKEARHVPRMSDEGVWTAINDSMPSVGLDANARLEEFVH
jgi:hypothetical protein